MIRITPDLLVRATGCTAERAATFAAHLDGACARYGISATPARLAQFLAQMVVESGALRYVREIADGAAYEGRADLGNTEPGDGPRFKGRGLIQTTGRANYRALRDRLRGTMGTDVTDFEADPEQLERPDWAAWSAADYWDMRRLNHEADADSEAACVRISRAVNRGNADSSRPANHEAQRVQAWRRARAALADVEPAAAPIVDRSIPVQPAPKEEATMPSPLLAGLASTVINLFTPLAAEKIKKEIGRHTDSAVAEQITAGVIDAAKAATGMADPIQAVAAVQQSPDALRQVEESSMSLLAQLAPVLRQLDEFEAAHHARVEASRDAASRRAAESSAPDQDGYLTRAIVRMLAVVLAGGSLLTAVLAYLKVDVGQLIGALILLVGIVGSEFRGRYQHRYGSSDGSRAKDAMNAAAVDALARDGRRQ